MISAWDFSLAIVLIAAVLFIGMRLPAAAEDEAAWRQERHCKYYATEINEHAVTRGMTPPC